MTPRAAMFSLIPWTVWFAACGGAPERNAAEPAAEADESDDRSTGEKGERTSPPPAKKALPPLEVRAKSLQIEGPLEGMLLQGKLEQSLGQMKTCLESELPGPFPGAYDFTLTFEIAADGKAGSLRLETASDDIKACVNHFMSVLHSIELGTSPTGEPTKVVYALDVTRGMYY